MRKLFLAAVIAIAATDVHADVLAGGQLEFAAASGGYASSNSIEQAEKENSHFIGGFVEYRQPLPNAVEVGMHFGFGVNSAEFNAKTDSGQSGYDLKIETDNSADILGVVSFPGENIRALAMFGYSGIEVAGRLTQTKTDANFKNDDAVMSGWKFAAGAEIPFAENWVVQTMLHYADYGSAVFNINPARHEEIELKKSGIRISLARRF